MQQGSHSELRHRILSALNLEPANSVTSLAQRLEVLRPSVSRAIKSLQDAGYIARTGRNLELSGAGQKELCRLDKALSTKVLKDVDLVTRIFDQAIDTGKQFEALTSSIDSISMMSSPGLRAIEGLASISSLRLAEAFSNSPLVQAVETIRNNSFWQISEVVKESALMQLGEAIKATASVQTANLDLLQGLHWEISSPINHSILENNLVLGTMISDLEAITQVGSMVDHTLNGLLSLTAGTAKAFDAYFMDMVSGVGLIATIDSLELSVSLPTIVAASLVGTTRSMVESEIIAPREMTISKWETPKPPVYVRRSPATTPKLEAYLQPLGQYFINIWEGAWQTLHSGNKDRYRQAAHSGRELLMQVLAHLAPDNVFTKEDCARYNVAKPTRKMRIRYILGGDCHSKVELINNMANTLDSMHDVLVSEAHRRDDENCLDDIIAGQLGALGNLLMMLLACAVDTNFMTPCDITRKP